MLVSALLFFASKSFCNLALKAVAWPGFWGRRSLARLRGGCLVVARPLGGNWMS